MKHNTRAIRELLANKTHDRLDDGIQLADWDPVPKIKELGDAFETARSEYKAILDQVLGQPLSASHPPSSEQEGHRQIFRESGEKVSQNASVVNRIEEAEDRVIRIPEESFPAPGRSEPNDDYRDSARARKRSQTTHPTERGRSTSTNRSRSRSSRRELSNRRSRIYHDAYSWPASEAGYDTDDEMRRDSRDDRSRYSTPNSTAPLLPYGDDEASRSVSPKRFSRSEPKKERVDQEELWYRKTYHFLRRQMARFVHFLHRQISSFVHFLGTNNTSIVVMLCVSASTAVMTTNATHGTKEGECAPKTGDGDHFAAISQATTSMCSLYYLLLPYLRGSHWPVENWFYFWLIVSAGTAIAAPIFFVRNWRLTLWLVYVSGLTQIIATAVLFWNFGGDKYERATTEREQEEDTVERYKIFLNDGVLSAIRHVVEEIVDEEYGHLRRELESQVIGVVEEYESTRQVERIIEETHEGDKVLRKISERMGPGLRYDQFDDKHIHDTSVEVSYEDERNDRRQLKRGDLASENDYEDDSNAKRELGVFY